MKSSGTLSLQLEGTLLDIQPKDFLQTCWTNGFDTHCTQCEGGFDAIAPPVRTLSLSKSTINLQSLPNDTPPVVIKNFHMQCLQRNGLKLFPISHAWHQPVAEAYASRESNPAAVQLVYELPLRTLAAVARRFGPDVHIWHDYMSIPQWNETFRGTKILPQIFDIFKTGVATVIHINVEQVVTIKAVYTADTLIEDAPALQTIFTAAWFSRMWPVVEYHACSDAYIMNSGYEVSQGTLSSLMAQVMHNSAGPAFSWVKTVPLFVRQKAKNLCLGQVFDMIGGQGCRSYHDRFIAASALLGVKDYMSVLPQNAAQACLWLSMMRLKCGDMSPLLLRPTAETPLQNSMWLKGHSVMNSNMWGWGLQTRSPTAMPQLRENHIYMEVQLLGDIVGLNESETPSKDSGHVCDLENAHDSTEALVVSVQCGECTKISLFTIELYLRPKTVVQVYGIPGLAYESSSLGAIAMVVEDDRIIGRSRSATQACDCNSRAEIRLI